VPDAWVRRDYSLVGDQGKLAVEHGLANAQWYATPIPRERLKGLMKRSDGPAIRDTIIWFAAFVVTGAGGYLLWGTNLVGPARLPRLWRPLRILDRGEVGVFMGADAVGRIVRAIGRAIDGEGAPTTIEPLDVLPLDLANRSDLNPAILAARCVLFRCNHAKKISTN
jgi:hypothetical protein